MIVTHFGSSGSRAMTWTVNQKNIRWWWNSSVTHHYQAVPTSVSGKLQRTITKNLARRQLIVSKTTSMLMPASSHSHPKPKPLVWWTNSAHYSWREGYTWQNGSATPERPLILFHCQKEEDLTKIFSLINCQLSEPWESDGMRSRTPLASR